jgi:hypothetical protein
MKQLTEKELLRIFNKYLKANSRARQLQTEFESALSEFNGDEYPERSEIMDIYIDFDIAGVPSATMGDMRQIIIQSRGQIA